MSNWILYLIEQWGTAGVFSLMLLESIFPPIPSEVVLPLTGFKAELGQINPLLAFTGATLGSVVGALPWYAGGRWLGADGLKRFAERHGRWLTLSPRELEKVDHWFNRHGGAVVLLGRLVPRVRTLISVPAGVYGMTLRRFLTFTTIGSGAWNALLLTAGWSLGHRFEQVGAWISPVSSVILWGALAWYLYRVAAFRRRVGHPAND